jgi:amino acid transporter
MNVYNLIFGKPLTSSSESLEQLGISSGIPVFGLDALTSAAYGPEAALTLLIPLGVASAFYIIPISLSIIVLLGIVFFSYRQTIAAYPSGGGSYIVASANLGMYPGLLAASALMIDYVLTAAVGISAGVGALVSAVPSLLPHTLSICLGILVLITVLNLRGLRSVGIAFMVPTYLFIVTLLGALGWGVVKAIAAGGRPTAVVAPPQVAVGGAVATAGVWLLLQSFASGCTAMTGVEAVSNGVRAFREPTARTAQRTLTVIIGILMLMLAGIAYLTRAYHIVAAPPGKAGYQSVLSMIVAAVAGRGLFYYVTIGCVLVVLALSANTAFADFPRLCHAISRDGFLPYPFAVRGRRLVYTQGVFALAILAGALLIAFRGVTDRLIPLYAIGAFLAFTLSQAGMVQHWRRNKSTRGWKSSMVVNGLGALATGITTVVVLVAKFVEGAWITALLIPALLLLMLGVHRKLNRAARAVATKAPVDLAGEPPLVIVPVQIWNRVTQNGLRLAMRLSDEVEVVHVHSEDDPPLVDDEWRELVVKPAQKAHIPVPKLVTLKSPYRYVVSPIVDHVLEVERKNHGRQIALVVPELVANHWYDFLLHNNRAEMLKALVLLKGNRRIAIINVPWYLREK